MKLEEYNDFNEKKDFFKFGEVTIDKNINTIFEKIEIFQSKGEGFIYRGCSEAKYKLYNSAQRFYISQELHRQVPSDTIHEHYNTFIESLIDCSKEWNKGVLNKLLIESGTDNMNALAYLSYMQHFGVPTPLLDFTFNPYVALFFAIDNISYSASDIEIDNYFSFYYCYKDSTIFQGWIKVFEENILQDNLYYQNIAQNEMSLLLPEKKLYQLLNNFNIINQEGLFFYNNHPWYPLERTYHEYIPDVLSHFGRQKFDELLMHDTIAGCFNIHKSLVPAIRKKLAEKGITKEYIYPDSLKLRTSVLDDAVSRILTL